MATPYTTGPALLYVGLPAESFTPRFLGTAESAPQIEHVKGFLPVMNDLAGQVYSFDDMYEGKEGFVRADLTRFNWPIYHVLANTTESDDEGTDDPGDIGSLMVTEDLCPVLWVRFPYNPLKPAMAAQGMPPGYRYLAAYLDTPEKFEAGTKPLKLSLNFHCKRRFDVASGKLKLFDRNMDGLPSID